MNISIESAGQADLQGLELMAPDGQSEKSDVANAGAHRTGSYPAEYTTEFQANDGTHFVVRPIRPDDEPLMVDFHRRLR